MEQRRSCVRARGVMVCVRCVFRVSDAPAADEVADGARFGAGCKVSESTSYMSS